MTGGSLRMTGGSLRMTEALERENEASNPSAFGTSFDKGRNVG
jgi:hypothetical protein